MKDDRPIALTNCIGKLLGRFVRGAHCSRRSTADAILYLMATVTSFIDNKAGNYVLCLFLDFCQRLNTISVQQLVNKYQYCWIDFYSLSDRHQFTIVSTGTSQTVVTNTGTTEGRSAKPRFIHNIHRLPQNRE